MGVERSTHAGRVERLCERVAEDHKRGLIRPARRGQRRMFAPRARHSQHMGKRRGTVRRSQIARKVSSRWHANAQLDGAGCTAGGGQMWGVGQIGGREYGGGGGGERAGWERHFYKK